MKKLLFILILLTTATSFSTGCKKTNKDQDSSKKEKKDKGKKDEKTDSPVCGDGTLSGTEQCDDNNTTSGDGCSQTCQIEAGYDCPTPGSPCSPTIDSLSSTCGNGTLDSSTGEACDDGNKTGGDGCSADCEVEDGYACPREGVACVKVLKTGVCGNGLLESTANETCDDGNRIGGDGCSATCKLEQGWTCLAGKGCTFQDTKCGDGKVDAAAGEECDWKSAGAPANCMKNCKLSVCGNGRFEVGEECEDGNKADHDGCSSSCKLEPGYVCDPLTGCRREKCGDGHVDTALGEECDDGNANTISGYGHCRPDCKKGPHCGDGIIYAKDGKENCDDGNANGGDGCSAKCQVEDGWVCPRVGQSCERVKCGNGVLDPGEGCDDANRTSGDGCSSTCYVEAGYICPNQGQPCSARSCGDGILALGEECDDGNHNSGDGCNKYCQLEYGFFCPTPGAACQKPVCGDGQVNLPEECDDGNNAGTDGCSSLCTIEKGFACDTPGQACHPVTCGNGIKEGSEECDDGGVADHDGCSSQCVVENGFGCSENSAGKSTCQPAECGNGKLEKGEECDDGNRDGGDGCDPICKSESYFNCRLDGHGKKVCGPVCGDGVTLTDAGEECDDGNRDAGDGCSPDCKVESGFTCTDFKGAAPKIIEIPMIIRDFRGDTAPNGHPDFWTQDTCKLGTGYLKERLAADGKPEVADGITCFGQNAYLPIYRGNSKQSFYYWYHDTEYGDPSKPNPYIKRVTYNLEFTQIDASQNKYQVSAIPKRLVGKVPPGYEFHQLFYPIDGQGWGDQDYEANNDPVVPNIKHNFLFTTEFKVYFKYTGKATLNFVGDDDLWVFINGKLALDMGGLRSNSKGHVDIQEKTNPVTHKKWDPALELYEGGIYEMKVFHAERYPADSRYLLTLTGFLNTGTAVCAAKCGDGKLAYGHEECDLGSDNSDTTSGGKYTHACSTKCTLNPGWFCSGNPTKCVQVQCGDGTVQYPEQCDDGNINDNDNCTNRCTLPHCGDGKVDPLEECDPKKPGETNCSDFCTRPNCGNLITETPVEECDDGNTNDLDGCSNSCKLPRCGDGKLQSSLGEVCDDGVNSGQYGSCTLDCLARAGFCGDGVVQQDEGEECDDGVNNGASGVYGACSTTCKRTSFCGDGFFDSNIEKCDDGNTNDSDGCSSSCDIEPGFFCTPVGTKSVCNRLG